MLYKDWHLNYFLDYIFDIFINSNNLRNYSLNFYEFRAIHSFLDNFFNLIDFRNLWDSINYFLNYLFDLFNLLNNSLNGYYFLDKSLNFYKSVLDIRNYPLNLFNFLLNNDIIDKLLYLNNFNLLFNLRHYLLSPFLNLLDLGMYDFYRYHFLYDSINWNLYLNWNYYVSVDFYYFRLLNDMGDYFLYL